MEALDERAPDVAALDEAAEETAVVEVEERDAVAPAELVLLLEVAADAAEEVDAVNVDSCCAEEAVVVACCVAAAETDEVEVAPLREELAVVPVVDRAVDRLVDTELGVDDTADEAVVEDADDAEARLEVAALLEAAELEKEAVAEEEDD